MGQMLAKCQPLWPADQIWSLCLNIATWITKFGKFHRSSRQRNVKMLLVLCCLQITRAPSISPRCRDHVWWDSKASPLQVRSPGCSWVLSCGDMFSTLKVCYWLFSQKYMWVRNYQGWKWTHSRPLGPLFSSPMSVPVISLFCFR